MSVSLEARAALRKLLAQVWRMVEEQAWEMLKQAVEGLLLADRDRRVGEARQRGGASPRSPAARAEEMGLVERYERHGLDEMLFALTVAGRI